MINDVLLDPVAEGRLLGIKILYVSKRASLRHTLTAHS